MWGKITIEILRFLFYLKEHFGVAGEKRKEGDLLNLGGKWYKVGAFDLGNQELVLSAVDTKQDTVHPQAGFYAPDFSLTEYNSGQELELKDFKGIYLVLDFWATWCKGCVMALPKFEEFNKKMKNQPVEILSVVCMSSASHFEKLREKHGMNWLHAWQANPTGIVEDYAATGYPVYFLIGPNGKILERTLSLESIEKTLSEHL